MHTAPRNAFVGAAGSGTAPTNRPEYKIVGRSGENLGALFFLPTPSGYPSAGRRPRRWPALRAAAATLVLLLLLVLHRSPSSSRCKAAGRGGANGGLGFGAWCPPRLITGRRPPTPGLPPPSSVGFPIYLTLLSLASNF